MAVSPLAPSNFPEMPEIAGVRMATAAAGIRYREIQLSIAVEISVHDVE